MTLCSINLGAQEDVRQLFSWPNLAGDGATLADTVGHWFAQTLARDGNAAIAASLRIDGGRCLLDLAGPAPLQAAAAGYAERLPAFLAHGLAALDGVVPKIVAAGKWNPDPTQPGDVWRFFLPLGLPLLNQRSLQFFHYPPLRLLDPMRDYLDDPVPKRWEELLRANGVAAGDEPRHECVMDATPIAAPDDQGSKKSAKGDPVWGLIPIQCFTDYQKAQVRLLLNGAPGRPGYTIPVVVYGAHPRDIFTLDFAPAVKLGVNVATRATIVGDAVTPVLATNHPYKFYAVAQGGGSVGSGKITGDPAQVRSLMLSDLAAARWQVAMAVDPTQDPAATLAEAAAYWNDPARQQLVSALIAHQGSLHYPDPGALSFEFLVPSPV